MVILKTEHYENNHKMRIAIQDGNRTMATPAQKADCPTCGSQVISKCGEIKVWHWAHSSLDCDTWSEPESQWHIDWKERFPTDWQEVTIGKHRADVKTPKGVIEFQASSISSYDVRAREDHYQNMVWVLKGSNFKENLEFTKQKGYHSFRWKHPRKTWWDAKKPIYIDMGNGIMFNIKKIHKGVPCGGWGKYLTVDDFMNTYNRKQRTLNDLTL